MDFSPIILTIMLLYLDASAQHQNVRVAPGVPPQHYDPNQQYMQQPPPPQHHNQFQQHQIPQQHHQPPPGQHQQFQQGQVPIQLQPQHGIPQHAVPQQHGVPQIGGVPQQHVSPQPHAHSHAGGHGGPGHGQPLLDTSNIANERQHIQEHMDLPIDTSQMSEQELQFHYFKMHDSDNNNKLDGCELVKSLIHWHEHEEGDGALGDNQIETVVDQVLDHDVNRDGMIDYPEFITAQNLATKQESKKKCKNCGED